MANDGMMSSVSLYVLFCFLVIGTSGDGSFMLTYVPSYMKCEASAGPIATSVIPTLLSSQYGFHHSVGFQWKGLKQNSMFKRPKASVILSLEGIPQAVSLPVEHLAKFDTKQDDDGVYTEYASNILRSANWETEPVIVDFSGDNTVYDIQAANPALLPSLTGNVERVRELYNAGQSLVKSEFAGTLNGSHDTDLLLLSEVQLIMEIAKALKAKPEPTRDVTPDFYHFRIGGLGKIITEYGEESQKVKDALHLVHIYVKKLSEEFKQMYSDNLVIQLVSLSPVDPKLIRKSRSLLAAPHAKSSSKSLEETLKVSPDYGNDYPVAFNMILWTTVIIALALLGISTAIWTMDPGRDSIIYRMTSQRIKKD